MIPRMLIVWLLGGVVWLNSACGQTLPHVWSLGFGDPDADHAASVAVDQAGNVLLAGSFSGRIDVGGGWLISRGGRDIYVAKFDPDGRHLWSRSFGDEDDQYAFDICTLPNGLFVLVGHFYNRVDFGCGPLVSLGDIDAYVARFAPDGSCLWSRGIGGQQVSRCMGVACDAEERVYVVGYFSGQIDVGGGLLVSGGGFDIWHAALEGNAGGHVWSKGYGGEMDQFGRGIALLENGWNVITGWVRGEIDCGGGPLISAGEADLLLASFEPGAGHRWSRLYGDEENQIGMSVAVDPTSSRIVLIGSFNGTIDLGGGPLTSTGDTDVILASLEPDGGHGWSAAHGGTASDNPVEVTVNREGEIAVAGYFQGIAQFGGPALISAGETDVFIATYGPDGSHRTSQNHGDENQQMAWSIAPWPEGGYVVAGDFYEGSIDFGGGPLLGAGNWDAFLARLGPWQSAVDLPGLPHPGLELAVRPNPVIEGASILYSLSEAGRARLDMLDAQGRLLQTLVDAILPAGASVADWKRPAGLEPRTGSGLYFLRLASESGVRYRRFVLVD